MSEIVELNKLCRACLCLKDDQNMKSLLTIHNDNKKLIEMLQELLNNIEKPIASEQAYPQGICMDCEKNLILAFYFKKQCNESENILNSVFNNKAENITFSSVKAEIDNVSNEMDLTLNTVRFTEPDASNICTGEIIFNELPENNTSYNINETIFQDDFFDNDYLSDLEIDPFKENDQFDLEFNVKLEDEKCNLDYESSDNNQTEKIIKKSNVFQCSICSMEYTNFKTYKSHWFSHQPKDLCPICGKLLRIFSLSKHILDSHSEIKPQHECPECHKNFTTKPNLYQHMRKHKGEKRYSCDFCDEQFSNRQTKLKHMDVLHNCIEANNKELEKIEPTVKKSSYKCFKCNKIFSEYKDYRLHWFNHKTNDICKICERPLLENVHEKCSSNIVPKREHVCTDCGKSFTTRSNLYQHIRTHKGDKRFACEFCDEKFYDGTTKSCHIRTYHNPEKAFKCDLCPLKFRHKGSLREHVLKHRGEYPHICQYCERGFLRKSGLENHLVTHTKERNYSCEICDKKFPTRRYVKIHQRVHTGEKNYVCSICSKAFTQSSSLRGHLKTHPDHPIPPPRTVLSQRALKKSVCQTKEENQEQLVDS